MGSEKPPLCKGKRGRGAVLIEGKGAPSAARDSKKNTEPSQKKREEKKKELSFEKCAEGKNKRLLAAIVAIGKKKAVSAASTNTRGEKGENKGGMEPIFSNS